MAQLNPADTLPESSAQALEIFDERYIAALAVAQPSTWVDSLGESHSTPSMTTHYPMSLLSMKYEETIAGEGRFRTLGEKDCELTVVEYDDGVEIELVKLLTNTFAARKWSMAPMRMLQAEQMFKTKLIADALHANTALCGWDGLPLFDNNHLANGRNDDAGTFDNLQATTKNVADLAVLEAESTLMAEVLDENGDALGVRPDTIGVPRQKFQALANLLKQDFVPSAAGTATMRNPYGGGVFNVVEMDKIGDNDANDWYLLDSKLIARGVVPWTVAKLSLPSPGFDSLSLRRFDENSDHFKKTSKIAVSSHIYYGFKFLFPHAIRKIAGA
jgi:hypothetical protein